MTALLVIAPAALASQMKVQAGVQIASAEHRILDADILVPTSGTLFAASAAITVKERVEIRGQALGGHFAVQNAPSLDDHDVAELQLLAGIRMRPWLSLQVGPLLRSFSNPLSRQHWTVMRVGAEARTPVGFENVSGVLNGYWMPIVSVSGLPTPHVAFAASLGVEWRGARIGISSRYSLERFDFPSNAGTRRLEELAMLQLAVSVWIRRR